MNRTQRAKIRTLRNAQNLAKSEKNREIAEFGRGVNGGRDLKCLSRREKLIRNDIRDYKVAIETSKEEITA